MNIKAMKKVKIWSLLLMMGIACTLYSKSNASTLTEADTQEKIVLYVSFKQMGTGTGKDETNAADFLNESFWHGIHAQLQKKPVEVIFLPGNYSRAYTQKPLTLQGIGNEKNQLTISGVADRTIFEAVVSGNPDKMKGVMVDVVDSQHILIKNLSFTGNGKLGYALRIRSTKGQETKNIIVSDCTWLDMRGIVYGTTGVHQAGTRYVTYKNCTFKRVGIDSHSHHIYNAYNPSHIYVLDSHFEDCTGDYVRFRDSTDFCVVKGSKFVRNKDFPSYPFISMPNFNKKRTESFASNYAFSDNDFSNNGDNVIRNAIALHHYGFDRPGFNYLLTEKEGKMLSEGSPSDKKKILKDNFGIYPEQIRVHNNRFSGKITNKVAVGSFPAYGAESKGWKGFGDIYEIVRQSDSPYDWEKTEQKYLVNK